MQKPANNDHPIHEPLRERWSPRAFDPRPIDRDTLLSLMEAVRWTPSSRNEQPWRYIVATRDHPEAFARMLDCVNERNRRWAQNAAVLLLTAHKHDFGNGERPNRMSLHDLGQSVMSLTIQATVAGLVVHQMAGILPDVARDTYGVPDGYSVETIIAIGYQAAPETLPDDLAERERAPRSRKALRDFVFADRWEQAAGFLDAPDSTSTGTA